MANIQKTIILSLVLFSMMFCSSKAGFNAFPDSYYDSFGPGLFPNRYDLGYTKKFNYCDHNMIRVSHDAFSACNTSNPISALVDNTFTFEEYGDYYFICKFSWLCDDLQKDFIRIGSYEPITPTPAPPSRSIPAPSSRSAPAPSPGRAPAPAPFTFD